MKYFQAEKSPLTDLKVDVFWIAYYISFYTFYDIFLDFFYITFKFGSDSSWGPSQLNTNANIYIYNIIITYIYTYMGQAAQLPKNIFPATP